MEPFDLVNKLKTIKKTKSKVQNCFAVFHMTEKVIPEMYQRVRAKVLELLKS